MRQTTVPPAPSGSFSDDDVSDGVGAITETFTRREAPGVAIVDGFGARLHVDRGELQIVDGIGPERRVRRWARSDRTLRRVVITARSGSLSIDALRWVTGVGAALVVLDDEGAILSALPGRIDNSVLRRAQAQAAGSTLALDVARYLLDRLLQGRSRLACSRLCRPAVADTLDEMRSRLDEVEDVDALRMMEMAGAAVWWSGWDAVNLRFVATDRRRIPDAWATWPGRTSVLGGAANARHATHPTNAIANLGYRVAEIEATIAIAGMGLDSAFGVSHTDEVGRSSFSLDVLEGLRPTVEELVLELIEERPFLKRDFTEARTGTGELRVAAPFSHEFVELLTPRLTATSAPLVEHVARMFAEAAPTTVRVTTPLTRSGRKRAGKASWATREARASTTAVTRTTRRKPERRCEGCGVALAHHQRRWCASCWPSRRAEAGKAGAVRARAALDDGAVRELKGRAISAGRLAARDDRARASGWEPEDWEDLIRPGLRTAAVTAAQVQEATGVGRNTAYRALEGRQVPAPRHWTALAELAHVVRSHA
jgi:CRISPR-associated protein Cas1